MALNRHKRLIVFHRDITILCHQFDSARSLIWFIRKALLVLLFPQQIFHGIRYIDLPKLCLCRNFQLFQIFFTQFKVNIAVGVFDRHVS